MRNAVALAVFGLAVASQAQVMFDDITKGMASPKWNTVLVGANSRFNQAGTHVIRSYADWQRVWPYVAGNNYYRGQSIPSVVDWRTQQVVVISLGNLGAQGYGIYVDNVRRTSSYGFDINYVITRPSFQAGISYNSFNYGYGTSPYVAITVPRSYGIPSYYSRYYSPPSYVVNHGCGCDSCRSRGGHAGAQAPFGARMTSRLSIPASWTLRWTAFSG